ncbi:unnamed protein product [Closterium sp. NIES-65]|nr:unnamed protein product [Closterium sp. NIES-65]
MGDGLRMRKVGVEAEAELHAAAELCKQTPLAELRTLPATAPAELRTADALRAATHLQSDVTAARTVLADESRCPRLSELYEPPRRHPPLPANAALSPPSLSPYILPRRSDLMELRAEVLSLLRLQEGEGERGGKEQGAGERERGECGAGSADGEREELAFVRLYEVVVETGTALHLILEYCPGGDLFDLVIRQKRLTEAQAASVFRQLLLAVHAMHRTGIVHRDLKPENILLSSGPASSPFLPLPSPPPSPALPPSPPSPALPPSPPSPALPPSPPSPALPPSSPFHLSRNSHPPSPSLASHPSSACLSLPPSSPTASLSPLAPPAPPCPPLCSSPPPSPVTTAASPPPCPCTAMRVNVADFGLAATPSSPTTTPPRTITATSPPTCPCTGIQVKVADFGLAATLSRGQTAACGVVGSPLYMAPEIIRGRPYAGEVDMWSLGCILYTSLSVLGSAPDLKGEVWEGISREAKQLLRCLLVTDPGRRLKAHEVLNHPWVRAACGGECGRHEREWGKEKTRENGEGVVREGGSKTDCRGGTGERRSGKGLTAEGKVSGGVVHVEKAWLETHPKDGANGQHVVGYAECCAGCHASKPHTCCQSRSADAAGRLAVQEKVGESASRSESSPEVEQVHGLTTGCSSGRSVSATARHVSLPFNPEPPEQSTRHSEAAVRGEVEGQEACWEATVQDFMREVHVVKACVKSHGVEGEVGQHEVGREVGCPDCHPSSPNSLCKSSHGDACCQSSSAGAAGRLATQEMVRGRLATQEMVRGRLATQEMVRGSECRREETGEEGKMAGLTRGSGSGSRRRSIGTEASHTHTSSPCNPKLQEESRCGTHRRGGEEVEGKEACLKASVHECVAQRCSEAAEVDICSPGGAWGAGCCGMMLAVAAVTLVVVAFITAAVVMTVVTTAAMTAIQRVDALAVATAAVTAYVPRVQAVIWVMEEAPFAARAEETVAAVTVALLGG